MLTNTNGEFEMISSPVKCFPVKRKTYFNILYICVLLIALFIHILSQYGIKKKMLADSETFACVFIFNFQREQYVVPSICIYGHTATGKSLVLKSIMTAMQVCSWNY